jgi:peptidoglycan/LPS O-acetylase OafA/YrhL
MVAFRGAERTTHLSDRNVVLDGMRGVAAIMVMALHYTEKNDTATLGRLKLFGSGYLAVDLFFALSGFVIFRSYAGALAEKMTAQEYVLKRFIRLYPMFLLGSCLGLVALVMIANETAMVSKAAIFRDFSFNALGLPCPNVDAIYQFGARVPTVGELFPTNPPSWSLFFEVFASLAFLFVYRLDERLMLWIAAGALAALLLCGYTVSLQSGNYGPVLALGWGTSNFLGGFPRVVFSFAAGIFICMRFMKTPRYAFHGARGDIMSLALYGVVVSCLIVPNLSGGFYELFVVAIISPLLVVVAAHIYVSDGAVKRISDFLGWLSYPLYCVHYPVGRVVWHLGYKYGLSNAANVVASISISTGIAILAGAFFDEPVRRKLFALLMRCEVTKPNNRQAGAFKGDSNVTA